MSRLFTADLYPYSVVMGIGDILHIWMVYMSAIISSTFIQYTIIIKYVIVEVVETAQKIDK